MYMTVNGRYMDKLYMKRDQTKKKLGLDESKSYRYSGRKNKRPLTMSAAEGILLKYYRDRSNQYKNPLSAMRKNIASCHKDPKQTLYACQSNEKKMPIITQQYANSWKLDQVNILKVQTNLDIMTFMVSVIYVELKIQKHRNYIICHICEEKHKNN